MRMSLKAFNNTKDTVWNLQNEHINEKTTIAFLRIDEHVKFSKNHVSPHINFCINNMN
ncbi:hypothetical protein KSP39_PZI005745 [Platanthera zijinensis]|uniref:Uncharacterized protein n=1 Tax=Platanthera zijinensis TaxID=2320716 RepID=A0AAP0GAU9_9ASPA